jgi:hypothetical protein
MVAGKHRRPKCGSVETWRAREVPQLKGDEIYYSCCAMINCYKRCRQGDLMLENKPGTMNWSMQVNMIILGMIIVDPWLAFDGCTRIMLNGREK